MSSLTLNDLLEAGAHFGHQTKRWNPKMKRFILCPRNGIYILDLNKTLGCIEKFLARVNKEVAAGGKVLFVGTKKQVKDCIREEATRCGMPYVTERWLGGMLTNFQTIRKNITTLEKIEAMEKDGTFEAITKKERLLLLKRKEKLLSVLAGIRYLKRLPAIIFVVDTIKEHIAIAEGRRLRIPIGAIVDTNCDPDLIEYPMPANDDALKSVQLITKAVADEIVAVGVPVSAEEMKAAEAAKAPAGQSEEAEEPEIEAVPGLPADLIEDAKAKHHRVVHKKVARFPKEA
ncbi:MAG: 30S ribosomal protein S2 [Chitinispirillaceae bacterium]|nr:30S ribosomal protein S2 [Chitinispirillaceae bacterium]